MFFMIVTTKDHTYVSSVMYVLNWRAGVACAFASVVESQHGGKCTCYTGWHGAVISLSLSMWQVADSSPDLARVERREQQRCITLALKPMSRVIHGPKHSVPVAPQNDDLSPQTFKKIFKYFKFKITLRRIEQPFFSREGAVLQTLKFENFA